MKHDEFVAGQCVTCGCDGENCASCEEHKSKRGAQPEFIRNPEYPGTW